MCASSTARTVPRTPRRRAPLFSRSARRRTISIIQSANVGGHARFTAGLFGRTGFGWRVVGRAGAGAAAATLRRGWVSGACGAGAGWRLGRAAGAAALVVVVKAGGTNTSTDEDLDRRGSGGWMAGWPGHALHAVQEVKGCACECALSAELVLAKRITTRPGGPFSLPPRAGRRARDVIQVLKLSISPLVACHLYGVTRWRRSVNPRRWLLWGSACHSGLAAHVPCRADRSRAPCLLHIVSDMRALLSSNRAERTGASRRHSRAAHTHAVPVPVPLRNAAPHISRQRVTVICAGAKYSAHVPTCVLPASRSRFVMDGPLIAAASHVRLARVARVGELCLIPLSNNIVALITWRTGLDLYPALAAALYLYVGVRYLSARGSRFQWSWHNAGIGTVAGLAPALPATLFFVHTVVVSTVSYGLLAGLSVNGLILRLFIDLTVLTAIIEELVFRYWLYFETLALPRTLLINAALFTTWHVVAAYTAVLATQLGTSSRLPF